MTDAPQFTPAKPDDIAEAIAFALRYSGRKRVNDAGEMMATIVAKRLVEHLEADGLGSTRIELPKEISPEPVGSLNHALTKLSEAYETWRISHTGNVYERVLYQERNKKWYPLDVLRNEKLEKQEKEIAKELWEGFLAKMAPTTML